MLADLKIVNKKIKKLNSSVKLMLTLLEHIKKNNVCQDLDSLDCCGSYITEATESLNKSILGITAMIQDD